MSCACKQHWFYRHTLVIRSINLIIKYDIKCLNNLMMLSICKEKVDNLDMNGDVKLGNVPRWWESKTDIWVQVTISVIYCRFIVRFTRGLELLFITFLLQFFLSISSSATYSSTFSNHICVSIDIISVYLKVAMHQGSVLSPLLFGVVMDVIPREARSGIYLPSGCMLMT